MMGHSPLHDFPDDLNPQSAAKRRAVFQIGNPGLRQEFTSPRDKGSEGRQK